MNGIATKVEFEGKVYSLSIGHDTKWFGQIPTIMLVEEEYDENKKVIWANILYQSNF